MALGMHYIFMSLLRFVQFVMAITVCGLYGVDLHNASAAGKYSDSKWVGPPIVSKFCIRRSCRCFVSLRSITNSWLIGIRRSSGRSRGVLCCAVLHPGYNSHPIHLPLGHPDFFPLDRFIWYLWQCEQQSPLSLPPQDYDHS